MIRKGLISDCDKLLELCAEHYIKVGMEDRLYGKFNKVVARQTLFGFLSNQSRFITLISHDYTGIIVYSVDRCWFTGEMVACEILWYARSPKLFIKLFKNMESILKLCEVKKVSVGLNNNKSVVKFLGKKGYILTDNIMGRRF